MLVTPGTRKSQRLAGSPTRTAAPAADAGVDVQRDAARRRTAAATVRDRVEGRERVGRRRDDDERDVVAESRGDARRHRDRAVGGDRHEVELEPEVVRGLLEGGVHGDRREQPRRGIRIELARAPTPDVPRRLHREQAALGAAGRDAADDLVVAAQQVAHEADDLALHDRDRGEGRRVEPVDRLHRARSPPPRARRVRRARSRRRRTARDRRGSGHPPRAARRAGEDRRRGRLVESLMPHHGVGVRGPRCRSCAADSARASRG